MISMDKSSAVFTKVLKTLQDIRSGKLTIFTRPGTSLPDRKKYRIITQNQNFYNLPIFFIVKQEYIVILKTCNLLLTKHMAMHHSQ